MTVQRKEQVPQADQRTSLPQVIFNALKPQADDLLARAGKVLGTKRKVTLLVEYCGGDGGCGMEGCWYAPAFKEVEREVGQDSQLTDRAIVEELPGDVDLGRGCVRDDDLALREIARRRAVGEDAQHHDQVGSTWTLAISEGWVP